MSETIEGRALLERVGESNNPYHWSETDSRITHSDPDCDWCIWIGREWKAIADDETGAAFKGSIRTMVCSLLGEGAAAQCETHEEAWYNG
jgi:hypothetical protein